MQQSMQWNHLFSARRSGDAVDKVMNPDRLRTSFTRDYDRIIFSSAFRRLQNKTQVFPLPGPVFVHNRLTHSLEVASVGRSLGRLTGLQIAENATADQDSGFQEFYRYELGTVIAAACLAHDIGNPPFGHSGEDAIRAYFTEMEAPLKRILEDQLSPNQIQDFEKFEGNSNALRILTHSFNEPLQGGYNLTHSTLAAIVKYPCSSLEGFNKRVGLISCKKSGFFDSELKTFESIAQSLGIFKKAGFQHVYARHPFVYLTEAADDICYRVVDLEDAHRLHIISLDTFKSLFLPFFACEEGYYGSDNIQKQLGQINDPNQQVQYMRAVWIGLMVEKLTQIFLENEQALLSGTLEKSLMDLLPAPQLQLVAAINRFSYDHIYNHKPVVEIEITGFHVIGALLKEFNQAVLYPQRTKSDKLLQLVARQFPISKHQEDLYGNLQSVVDFISGMTDLYALDLYRKITGIDITEL